MNRLIFLLSALLVSHLTVASIDIQRSTDGGSTWEPVPAMQATEGFHSFGASGAACAESVIPETSESSTLPQQRRVPFANPGSNESKQTFLRFINPNTTETRVELYGIDDSGEPNKSGAISFTLAPEASLQFTAQDMENGSTSKGLTNSFCDGDGKWQLVVRSDQSIEVMSLIRAPGGFLTSLNEVVPSSGNDRLVYFVNTADEPDQQTFLRVLNRTTNSGTITITAVDDDGLDSPSGDVSFTLDPQSAREVTVQDLESGTGVSGMLGDGSGRWRMTVTSTNSLEVMSLVETSDGFLTNMSRPAPSSGLVHEVLVFNPASNTERRSSLRIVNSSNSQASITIAGVDDNGVSGDNDVTLNLTGGSSIAITAQDLENGNASLGLVGALGNGAGKWRLTITSDVAVDVQGTLDTPAGFITNLSRATEDETTEKLPSQNYFDENISASIIQGNCIVCHVSNGVASTSALIYERSTSAGYMESNYQVLVDYISNGNGATILSKASGVVHGGGEQLASDSAGYQALSDFIDLVEEEVSPPEQEDPNSSIQALMALPELNCTSSSCHDATPGTSRVNLLTGTIEELAARLVDQPSGSPSCSTEKLIDSLDPSNSLLLKLINQDSGEQCISKMPLGGDGVTPEQYEQFAAWVDQLIENADTSSSSGGDSVAVAEPIDGFRALGRAKYILHGGALTDEDYNLAIDSQGELDIAGMRSAISSWFDTPAFKRKMLSFLGSALHQDEHGPIVPNYFEMLGVTWGQSFCTPRPQGLYRHDEMEVVLTEIVPRTAYRLIETDADFRTLATTNQIVTNSIGLFAFALSEAQLPEGADHIEVGHNLCQYEDLSLSDFEDWRTVELTPSSTPASFEPKNLGFINSLRAIPEGGSFALKANRSGICNSFSFFANFPTNESNQFRLNASQCMIASLGHIFEAGDTTTTNSLDGLDSRHVDPNTECFGCHQHLDPMTNVFRGQYDLRHRLRQDIPADNDGDFSFQGHSKVVTSMDDFNEAIRTHPDFAMGIATKLCQWATSQTCSSDDPNLQAVVADFASSGYKFKQLVLSMFTSPMITTVNQSGDYANIGSNISTTRAQHMCLALETRMEQQLATERVDSSQPDPKVCRSEYYAREAASTIPRDLFQRGYPQLIQASTINLITPKLFEPLCDEISHPVMQAFDAYHSEKSAETLDSFTKYLLGIPEAAAEYSSARQSLQDMYDLAQAPACSSTSALSNSLNGSLSCGFSMDHHSAMRFVFRNACLSPATTAIGL